MENKTKILIVDDEENICELVRLYIAVSYTHLIDKDGCLLYTYYNNNNGNPVETSAEMLSERCV